MESGSMGQRGVGGARRAEGGGGGAGGAGGGPGHALGPFKVEKPHPWTMSQWGQEPWVQWGAGCVGGVGGGWKCGWVGVGVGGWGWQGAYRMGVGVGGWGGAGAI